MFRLGRILGIEVSLHWTLLLLIAFAGFVNGAAAYMAAIFGFVLLHELGHSMAARQFGISTDSIVLLPIGGIASLERMPRDPYQELWIAVAGPLVNVVLAAAFFALWCIPNISPVAEAWVAKLMVANIGLVVFNMLPAFPMDGGRVLRSVLAMNMNYVTATQIAARVGRFMAIVLGLVGLYFSQLMLVIVAGFVYFAGSAEARAVVASQFQRDWPNTISGAFQNGHVYRAGRPGETVNVIWDEVTGKYRYA